MPVMESIGNLIRMCEIRSSAKKTVHFDTILDVCIRIRQFVHGVIRKFVLLPAGVPLT